MHKLKEKIMEELEMFEEKAAKSGSARLSEAELNKIHKLTDTVKNLDKIEILEEQGGYSEAGDWMGEGRMYGTSYDDGMAYARGGRGRGRNAKRDRMGRYSSDGGYSEDGMAYARDGRGGNQGGNRGGSRGGYGGYSRDGDDMMERLEEMMAEASTPKQREAIKRCMHELEE